MIEGFHLIRKLEREGIANKDWRIITLVRDPVRRNLSAFFQTLNTFYLDTGFPDRIRNMDPSVSEELADYFVKHFKHHYPLDWLYREFKTTLGLDLLAQEFDPQKGFKIYHHHGSKILLIRFENLYDCAQQAFESFLGLKNLKLSERNVSNEKYYSKVYAEVLKDMVLPELLLKNIYSSPYVRRFYTPDEIEQFAARWRER